MDSQCTECLSSTEPNPHSTSLCRDCHIKQLMAMLEDANGKLSIYAAEARFPNGENSSRIIEGTWPKNDPRRGFVVGAKWCFYELTGGTMWQSDRNDAEKVAQAWADSKPQVTRAQIGTAILRAMFDVSTMTPQDNADIAVAVDSICKLFGVQDA